MMKECRNNSQIKNKFLRIHAHLLANIGKGFITIDCQKWKRWNFSDYLTRNKYFLERVRCFEGDSKLEEEILENVSIVIQNISYFFGGTLGHKVQ